MLRSISLSNLQKAYDDSYLCCSTAVYYESQGDEPEAMRCWKNALELIYQYRAIDKRFGDGNTFTDTETALSDAVKELEIQCKERIDLLGALITSRQEHTVSKPFSRSINNLETSHNNSWDTGCIGQGTIPAMTYAQLSRPTISNRPSSLTRTISENGLASDEDGPEVMTNSSAKLVSSSWSPSKPKTVTRQSSPEKHCMRTTLRPGKGESFNRSRHKSNRPVAEGSSKAATLAWSASGSRQKLQRASPAETNASSISQNPSQPARFEPSQLLRDNNPRSPILSRRGDELNRTSRDKSYQCSDGDISKSSLLSLSAASSALNSSSNLDMRLSNKGGSKLCQNPATNRVPSDSSTTRSRQKYYLLKNWTQTDNSAITSEPSSEQTQVAIASAIRGNVTQLRCNQERESKFKRDLPPGFPKLATPNISDVDVKTPRSQKRTIPRVEHEPGGQTIDGSSDQQVCEAPSWKQQKGAILKSLPPGIDENAARHILNDVIIQGDEVRWHDIAGLDNAKNALRETVVYPFLRPDLFMGLREPARGMLLFGPPGTGKTMLARAVATESQSTFFSISASSLTSKFLGESERLVRALFGLARVLAPSIIFVDEIDSLLSQRSGSGEHEATRRIKTEFLIQWSSLQRAAAGREFTSKDKEQWNANRVLVLAATNMPWAIDEAARRRFVRRQYIPLPESITREIQLKTLLGQQKHSLSSGDIHQLVQLTDGFSGSDITALAKDAAMGPLRSLGEALLQMKTDDIRPIMLADFETSLGMIRPSVSKRGLREYEDWAKEFGERGG